MTDVNWKCVCGKVESLALDNFGIKFNLLEGISNCSDCGVSVKFQIMPEPDTVFAAPIQYQVTLKYDF